MHLARRFRSTFFPMTTYVICTLSDVIATCTLCAQRVNQTAGDLGFSFKILFFWVFFINFFFEIQTIHQSQSIYKLKLQFSLTNPCRLILRGQLTYANIFRVCVCVFRWSRCLFFRFIRCGTLFFYLILFYFIDTFLNILIYILYTDSWFIRKRRFVGLMNSIVLFMLFDKHS